MNEFNAAEYWQNRLGSEFSLGGVGQIGWGRHFNAWAYRARRRVFLQVVRALDMDFSTAKVLDIGTGTGFYVKRWKELGVRSVTGADLTEVAVSRLRERYPECSFYRVDIGETLGDLGGQRFDAISCIDVLFHIVDDVRYRRAIENMHELLRPGGWLVLTEGGVVGHGRRAAYLVHRGADVVTDVLRAAGFRIVTRRPFLVLLNDPIGSEQRVLRVHWNILRWIMRRAPVSGVVLGPILYVLEMLVRPAVTRAPSTEIIACRRPPERFTGMTGSTNAEA